MTFKYDPEITPEMRARYLRRREADVASLETAVSAFDFATISAVAHQIKGNAATFSFYDLEAQAVALEEAAVQQDLAACRIQIQALGAWLKAQA